jgi:hypothetical protein
VQVDHVVVVIEEVRLNLRFVPQVEADVLRIFHVQHGPTTDVVALIEAVTVVDQNVVARLAVFGLVAAEVAVGVDRLPDIV